MDSSQPIKLTANLEAGKWLPDHGLRRPGEYLAYIGDEEVDYDRWTDLTVDLPDDEPLPYDLNSVPVLPPDVLTNLKRLTWKAHREQLIASWIPFNPSLLNTLSTLFRFGI
ncbi:hypothetical protein DXG01_003440 [Tephrocybe rancida]|nr:hypothetical protein DXG01_003440 [Tephrocybe rancida]